MPPPVIRAHAVPDRTKVPSPWQAPAGTPREPAIVTERFTGIHIGSVEVEILPSPNPVTPPVAVATARASTVAVTRLARGLTSSIGLRQS